MITHFLHCLLFARISEQWVLVVACNNLQAHQRGLLLSPRQRMTPARSFVSFLESSFAIALVNQSQVQGARFKHNNQHVTTLYFWIRPYCAESTASRPISEVKLRQASLVLGWETTRESGVPYPFVMSFVLLCQHKEFLVWVFFFELSLNSFTSLISPFSAFVDFVCFFVNG